MPITTATTTSSRIVVPTVANMDANGSGSYAIDYVLQEVVNIAGIDHEYDVSLNEVDAAEFLNCFTVSGGYKASGNETNTLEVELTDGSSNFITLLKKAMDGKKSAAETDAEDDIQGELNAARATLFLQAIKNELVANVVASTISLDAGAVSIDTADGATNMMGELQDASAGIPACTQIFTQIPNDTLMLYKKGVVNGDVSGSEDLVTNALPLKAGDKLTFVFDIDVGSFNLTRSGATNTVNQGTPQAPATAAAANPSGYALGSTGATVSYNPIGRRLAFNVLLANDVEAGSVIAGLRKGVVGPSA